MEYGIDRRGFLKAGLGLMAGAILTKDLQPRVAEASAPLRYNPRGVRAVGSRVAMVYELAADGSSYFLQGDLVPDGASAKINWQSPQAVPFFASRLAIAQGNPNWLAVGGNNNQRWSVDGGQSWQQSNSPDNTVFGMEILPDQPYLYVSQRRLDHQLANVKLKEVNMATNQERTIDTPNTTMRTELIKSGAQYNSYGRRIDGSGYGIVQISPGGAVGLSGPHAVTMGDSLLMSRRGELVYGLRSELDPGGSVTPRVSIASGEVVSSYKIDRNLFTGLGTNNINAFSIDFDGNFTYLGSSRTNGILANNFNAVVRVSNTNSAEQSLLPEHPDCLTTQERINIGSMAIGEIGSQRWLIAGLMGVSSELNSNPRAGLYMINLKPSYTNSDQWIRIQIPPVYKTFLPSLFKQSVGGW